MHVATVHLKSLSAYSQSRHYERNVPRGDNELHDDYERRTWRERLHYDQSESVYIPPMAFKNNLAETALFLSIKVPGRGNAKWTKHFEAGVLVTEGLDLGIKKDAIMGQWLHLNADGRKGGNTRVWRCMPVIPEWEGTVTYHILDETITSEVFEHHLREAGNLIGIGRFRPRRGGYYGRFEVKELDWR